MLETRTQSAKMTVTTLLVLSCATLALGQRPFFAGSRPIGYPEVTTEGLADRFGEIDGTTQRLPLEANGDRELVDRLSKLPIDKQPFWLINWQALEAHRQKPQTYPQKPNPFAESTANTATNTANKLPQSGSSGSSQSVANVTPVNDNRFGSVPSNTVSTGTVGSSGISGSSQYAPNVKPGIVNDKPLGSAPTFSSGSVGGSGSYGTFNSNEGGFYYGFVPNRYSAEEHPDTFQQAGNYGSGYNTNDKKNSLI